MEEIEAVSRKIHKLENAVIRAAVNRFYYSEQKPDDTDTAVLEAELSEAVDNLTGALQAIPWRKRDARTV